VPIGAIKWLLTMAVTGDRAVRVFGRDFWR
jgi:hypothetical protein